MLATASATPKTSRRPVPSECARKEGTQHGGECALRDSPWDRYAPNREQFLDVELEADAEHQQNDTDLRQLLCQRGVRHETWRVRADKRAGE